MERRRWDFDGGGFEGGRGVVDGGGVEDGGEMEEREGGGGVFAEAMPQKGQGEVGEVG